MRRTWTPDEDARLIELYNSMFRNSNWSQLASCMRNRTSKQCRERYMNHLQQGVVRSKITSSELETLKWCIFRYGTRWSRMTQHFEGRTDNFLKNSAQQLLSDMPSDCIASLAREYQAGTNRAETTEQLNEIYANYVEPAESDSSFQHVGVPLVYGQPISDLIYSIHTAACRCNFEFYESNTSVFDDIENLSDCENADEIRNNLLGTFPCPLELCDSVQT